MKYVTIIAILQRIYSVIKTLLEHKKVFFLHKTKKSVEWHSMYNIEL